MGYSRKDIYEKAEAVNALSLGYQLSHAASACDLLLQDSLRESSEKAIGDLNKKREIAYARGNVAEYEKLTEEIGALKKRHFHIYVEYVNWGGDEIDAARTIYVDNQLVIHLPEHLKRGSIDSDGRYTEQVKVLRELMAHELGHSMLHTSDIMDAGYVYGSGAISKGDKEQEANIFRDKLLELRRERNERMRKDGTIQYF